MTTIWKTIVTRICPIDSKAGRKARDAAFVTRVYPEVVVHRAIATRVIDTANATPPAIKKKPDRVIPAIWKPIY